MKTERRKGVRFFVILFCLLAGSVFIRHSWGTEEFKHAEAERSWSFPADYGSHPEYRTEWWYFTGNLTDEKGRSFGYQLTFFRQALRWRPTIPENPWSIRDVHLAHFALADGASKKFWYGEQTTRTGPGLAHAKQGAMDVKNLQWFARLKDGVILIHALHKDMVLDLTLSPMKPVVLHGNRGLSRKGPNAGQASYYLSLTRLETRGTIKTPLADEVLDVTGTSWFDQEFGSNQLSSDQIGWDWFGIHLSDGRDLMVYMLRRRDGTIEPASSGTLIEKNGAACHLRLEEIAIEKGAPWKSPHTKAVYPAEWRISIPRAGIDIAMTPLVSDQELITSSSTRITYWEGAIGGKGTSKGRPVTVKGYAELTGYAGSLAGVF